MLFSRMINAASAHAAGEPNDVITGGVLGVPGRGMFDKMLWLRDQGDALRQFLLNDPRGKVTLCVNLILPSVEPDASFGFVIMEPDRTIPDHSTNNISARAWQQEERTMIPEKQDSWHADPRKDLGEVLVLRPEEGHDFYQPVPANGQISIRIAPGFVGLQSPFSLGTQTLPPAGYVREHSHPEHDEVIHFIRGTGKAVVDGEEHPVEPGVTIFVGRNRRHMFINNSQDELHWLWFIQPNGLETFFEEIGREVVPGQPDPTPFARPDNVLEIERRTAFALPPTIPYQPD